MLVSCPFLCNNLKRMQTITRKFIVKKIPNLNRKKCFIQERFYLYRKNGVVIRVQSSDNIFELERKVDVSELIRESEKYP